MAAHAGPDAIESGLVLNLDAANSKSYPGSGTAWTDLSGNSNNATLVNSVTYSAVNRSMVFSGGSVVYCTIPNSASLAITGGNIAIEVIFRSTVLANATHGHGLICKGSGANDGAYEILLVPQSGVNYSFFRCAGVGTYSPKIIPLSVNSICVMTCVMQNQYMRTYINGIEEGTGVQRTVNIASSTQNLTLGTREILKDTADSKFTGDMYSVRLYNRALSAAEVKQNFNALRGRYGI